MATSNEKPQPIGVAGAKSVPMTWGRPSRRTYSGRMLRESQRAATRALLACCLWRPLGSISKKFLEPMRRQRGTARRILNCCTRLPLPSFVRSQRKYATRTSRMSQSFIGSPPSRPAGSHRRTRRRGNAVLWLNPGVVRSAHGERRAPAPRRRFGLAGPCRPSRPHQIRRSFAFRLDRRGRVPREG